MTTQTRPTTRVDDAQARARQTQLAALAATQAARPSVVAALQRRYGTQPLHEIITTQMHSEHAGYPGIWMGEHGQRACLAVSTLTGMDESEASWFVGAALYVLLAAGVDHAEADVRQAAVAAVFWHKGSQHHAGA